MALYAEVLLRNLLSIIENPKMANLVYKNVVIAIGNLALKNS
jgi:hypothetical protein